ncbi:unnamed protein product [Tilletia laevis]|uniref:Rab-GAP TBC domain-containing protein n=4 Tax=Tilletia TaxID=13289 RepID=A0A8X7MWG2_9BASI|nr:hypothetical protein CF335_g1756 [Tilletia laevis]KAE8249767.1 hypothetical protein A4X06_0g3078 [Tilletia controversa]KAE8262977.1 hypothetical protein A4X03_0g2034 [Tilletia caries]CAD6891748.1 unnamed protein product [Tilletia caries]CAD6915162.1 unnamed protein product [Tilletia controversa]
MSSSSSSRTTTYYSAHTASASSVQRRSAPRAPALGLRKDKQRTRPGASTSSTMSSPLFDPLQGDTDTPTPSRFLGARAGGLIQGEAGASTPVFGGAAARSSVYGSVSSFATDASSSRTSVGGSSRRASAQAQGRREDEATEEGGVQDDLFGQKRISRVFGAQDRNPLFGDEEGAGGKSPAHSTGGADLDLAAGRKSRYFGLLNDDPESSRTPSRLGRSLSQTTQSSRAQTPLPDRAEDHDGAEPSLNLLATLHRMQDADIERYMRIFTGPARSSSSGLNAAALTSRSGSGAYSARGADAEEAPSISSVSIFEIPEVSTPSEDHSLHAPPSSSARQASPRPPLSTASSFHSGETQHEGSTNHTIPLPSASFAFVRFLSSALSTAMQTASEASADYEALTEEHERILDNKRREWEAREAAMRALCSQHGIKNGEIDRALMRASPLQQELEGRKRLSISVSPANLAGLLSPQAALTSAAPTPVKTPTKPQERFADPEADVLTTGGLSALHESLQEAMLDDLEIAPSAVTPASLATIDSIAEIDPSEESDSPAMSVNRHRRNSSKSTTVTSRTRDTSPGAASARSARSQRPLSISSNPTSEGTTASKPSAPPSSAKTTGAAVSAAATFSRAFWRTKKSPAGSSASSLNVKAADPPAQPNVTRLPSIFNFSSSATASAQQSPAGQPQTLKDPADKPAGSDRPGPKTVELDFMLPSDAKPPTFASLTRRESNERLALPKSQRERRRGQRSRDTTREGSDESSGDEFEVYGGKGSLVPPRPVFSDIGSDILTPQLLTDRYGFVYDATPADIKLLREARKASSSAPACLTGIRVGMRARGMDDSDEEGIETDQETSASAEPDSAEESQHFSEDEESEVSDDDAYLGKGDTTMMAGGASTINIKTAVAPAMLTLDLPPSLDFTSLDPFTHPDHSTPSKSASAPGLTPVSEAKPVIEASVILAESQDSGRLGPTSPSQEFEFKRSGGTSVAQRLEEEEETHPGPIQATRRGSAPRAPPTGSQTVRKLLSQLQSMHDQQQAQQQSEWGSFLKRRKERQLAAVVASAQLASKSSNRISRVFGTPTPPLASSPAPATDVDEEELILGLVGIQRLGETKAGKEDWAELQRLCRQGIPLCYRGAIWKECSGAAEMAEPGRYEELLGEHEGETNECLTQIDLDVHRTMPTNIFFGGNGPGVPKLRRVLVAFSWFDPVCGYCQGMNNLAATLLLTLPNEEDAFWTLACIIGKILPAEYYTSHLLVSQADQRVLVELVDEQLPKLAEHMREIGVDLPAVTFAWFLSLYTDCLPVETLFRVWDIIFIDGMVVLFRIAMAILSLSEKDLLSTSGPAAFYGHMHSLTSRMFSVDRLMKLACEDFAQTIKYPNILTRREKHVKDLRSELGLEDS